MFIANPIYDTVFKRLMENLRIARFFIETIIDTPVESIDVTHREYTLFKISEPVQTTETEPKTVKPLTVIRYDFLATIRTPEGYKKVLIEIQKAKNELDTHRFRTYLGEQYKRKDKILIDGEEKEEHLPVITIYMLGFKLPETEAIVTHVSRSYKDVIEGQDIQAKSEFIENLSHDSFVVQIPRIEGKTRSRLEKMLSIFEQKYFSDEKGILKQFVYEVDDEDIRLILETLCHAGADPATREEIEIEWRSNNFLESYLKMNQVIDEMTQALSEKDQVLAQNAQALAQNAQALAQKDQALAQKDQALAQKDITLVLNSHKAGLSIDTIASVTGLTPEEIRKILNQIITNI